MAKLQNLIRTLKAASIRKYGDNEEAAKEFWKNLIRAVYKRDPSAVPVMIAAQPDPDNKAYMQSVYDELLNG
jgi:hypothetical protein